MPLQFFLVCFSHRPSLDFGDDRLERVHEGLYPICFPREAEPGFRDTDQVTFQARH
jgi:hypothetical protein